ncbi:MAG TPA: hypothetical protein VGU71_03235 [Candidatus Dormibacteraeota bacterium]|nr:hypothetical protein [Candidatus Dormibacteraeota bacterium]
MSEVPVLAGWSPDGNWFLDGWQWNDAGSPDGKWRFDGRDWKNFKGKRTPMPVEPLHPPPPPLPSKPSAVEMPSWVATSEIDRLEKERQDRAILAAGIASAARARLAKSEEAIKLYQQAGDEWHRAQILMVMAEIQAQQGRIEDADRSLDEAARIAADMGSPYLQADCTQSRGTVRLRAGRIAEGRRLWEEAQEKFAEQGRADQVRASTALLEQFPAVEPG